MAYLAILVYFSFSTIVSSIDSLYFLGDFWSVLIWIKIHIFAQIQIIMPGMVCHARLFTIYSCLVHKIFTFKSGRLFLILRNWGEVHVFHCRVCTVAYKKPPKPCGSRGLSGGRYRTWTCDLPHVNAKGHFFTIFFGYFYLFLLRNDWFPTLFAIGVSVYSTSVCG